MNFDKTLSFQSIPGAISEADCREVRGRLEKMPRSLWAFRDQLSPGRGYPGEHCNYLWAGPTSIPKDLYDRLVELAPSRGDWVLGEVCVNKYLPGDFIGKHRDRDMFHVNMVVPLQALGDGVIVDGVFLPDVVGQANIFYNTGPAHSVPPVVHERYLLIFLYTEKST